MARLRLLTVAFGLNQLAECPFDALIEGRRSATRALGLALVSRAGLTLRLQVGLRLSDLAFGLTHLTGQRQTDRLGNL